MGNSENKATLAEHEVYLSDVQQLGQTDLMFQSKLSGSGYDTKLSRRLYPFNSASDNITSYLEKLPPSHSDSTSSDSTSSAITSCSPSTATSMRPEASAPMKNH